MNLQDTLQQARLQADFNMNPLGVMTLVAEDANKQLASNMTTKERRDLFRSLRHQLDPNTKLRSMIAPDSITSLAVTHI